jgi:hypothetical protein
MGVIGVVKRGLCNQLNTKLGIWNEKSNFRVVVNFMPVDHGQQQRRRGFLIKVKQKSCPIFKMEQLVVRGKPVVFYLASSTSTTSYLFLPSS